MDRLQVLSDIIKSVKYTIWCKEYYYPNMTKKVLVKITKSFDPQINTNNIVAVIDTSFTFKCKTGIIYTLTGIYNKLDFEKPFYFSYSDIENYYVQPNKKGKTDGLNGTLVINFKNGTTYSTNHEAVVTEKILNKILPVIKEWDDLVDGRETGIIEKLGLTENQIKACHAIIHSASAAAGGVGTGLAQIPLSDNAVITPIQITMITTLALKVFELRITEGAAKAVLGSAAAAFIGRGVSQVLWGWIPGIGNAINTATAAGITEIIGWIAVKHFAELNETDRAKYRIEGMKAGYEAASDEYEAKLRKQGDEFIKQKYLVKEQMEQYEKLLDEYEAYIKVLEEQIELLKNVDELEVPDYIISNYQDMKNQYTKLKDLKACS